VNLDHNLSQKNQLSGRFFYSQDSTNQPFTPFAATVPGWGINFNAQNTVFTLPHAHFRPDLINIAALRKE